MRHLIWVSWPSFVAAAFAELLFFLVMAPERLYFRGLPVDLSPTATYSLGFFLFWLICGFSSLLTYFLLPGRPGFTPPAPEHSSPAAS